MRSATAQALWPDAMPPERRRVPRHLADALAELDLPEAAGRLRAQALPLRDPVPEAWRRWGIADEDGLTSKGARVLEQVERLRAHGMNSGDLMHPHGLGVLRNAWNLIALRATPCPHPPAWRRWGLVDDKRIITAKGLAILDALERLALILDIPFGSLDS